LPQRALNPDARNYPKIVFSTDADQVTHKKFTKNAMRRPHQTNDLLASDMSCGTSLL
jgi:hypothetical protein